MKSLSVFSFLIFFIISPFVIKAQDKDPKPPSTGEEFEKKYPDQNNVPRPPHWSGWRLLPNEIEFWVDGEGRIHERLSYKKSEDKWIKEILYP